jgi:hypothetical protein
MTYEQHRRLFLLPSRSLQPSRGRIVFAVVAGTTGSERASGPNRYRVEMAMEWNMIKTPHYWAVILVHERMTYGSILSGQPDVLAVLKKELFKAAKEVITEAVNEAKQG